MEPEKINLRRLLTLPRELQRETLLKLSPNEISRLHETIPELFYIYNDLKFWFIKTYQIGVLESDFYNDDFFGNLPAYDRYLYFMLLNEVSAITESVMLRSYYDLTTDRKVLSLSIKYGYKALTSFLLDYFDRYEDHSNILSLVITNLTDEALTLLRSYPNININNDILKSVQFAVKNNNLVILRAFLDKFADLSSNKSILVKIEEIAAIFGRFQILKYLRSKYSLNNINLDIEVIKAALKGGYTDIAIYLLKSIDTALNLPKLYQIIEYAINMSNVRFVAYMINNFHMDLRRVINITFDEEGLQEEGKGPDYLHPERAAQIVQLLIDKGVDNVDNLLVDFLRINGFTREELYYDIIKVLIKNGAKLTPEIRAHLSTLDPEDRDYVLELFDRYNKNK